METHSVGMIASSVAMVNFVTQSFLMKYIKAYVVDDYLIIVYGAILMCAANVLECYHTDILMYCLSTLPLQCIGEIMIRTCGKSILSTSVPVEHIGRESNSE